MALYGFQTVSAAADRGGNHEPFAAIFGIVDRLEEAEIKRQVLLRDSAVGLQPGMQQGSEPFHRVDMDFVEAITVFVTGILPGVMADRFVLKAPFG